MLIFRVKIESTFFRKRQLIQSRAVTALQCYSPQKEIPTCEIIAYIYNIYIIYIEICFVSLTPSVVSILEL